MFQRNLATHQFVSPKTCSRPRRCAVGGVWPRRRVHPEGGVEGHPAVAAQGGGGRIPRRRIPRSGAMVSNFPSNIIPINGKNTVSSNPDTVLAEKCPFESLYIDLMLIYSSTQAKTGQINLPSTHERKELLAQLK